MPNQREKGKSLSQIRRIRIQMDRKLLEKDICSLIECEAITMSRGREILQLQYLNEMRDIYNEYWKKRHGKEE